MKTKSPASRADKSLKNYVLFGEEGGRAAKTGRFTTKKEATQRPRTIVTETVKPGNKR